MKTTKEKGYGIKVISSAAKENSPPGFGGWVQTTRGWETWCFTIPFPYTDINQAFRTLYPNFDQYAYYVEEVPIGTIAEL